MADIGIMNPPITITPGDAIDLYSVTQAPVAYGSVDVPLNVGSEEVALVPTTGQIYPR